MQITNQTISDIEQTSGGRLGVMAYAMGSGETVAHRPDERVPTASVIKLPLVIHAAMLAHEGQLDWAETLPLRDEDKVNGSGVLSDLTAGLRLSLRDLCQLTIVLSDNTATNMLIDRLGMDAINARIAALGLMHTRLQRKAFTPDTPATLPYGLGVSTPRETANLLHMLLRQDIIPAAPAQWVLDMLAAQRDRVGLPRYLPDGWVYAGKTGANDHLCNDVGIITAPDGRRWLIAAFCHDLPGPNYNVDNPGWLALAQLTKALIGCA
ncbi:MAG: class A beta-lactamase-related serine hydrolase [Anaerolineae bacterium]|nr:class A beta-lactamase-related serine hydrolase [Anaerolineae bacterium]